MRRADARRNPFNDPRNPRSGFQGQSGAAKATHKPGNLPVRPRPTPRSRLAGPPPTCTVVTSPHRKLLDLDAFRHRVADADALPQMAFLGTVAGLITGVVMLLFRGLIHLPLEFALPNHRSENFEALPPAVRFALVLGGAAALGLALRRVPRSRRSRCLRRCNVRAQRVTDERLRWCKG